MQETVRRLETVKVQSVCASSSVHVSIPDIGMLRTGWIYGIVHGFKARGIPRNTNKKGTSIKWIEDT